MSTSFLVLAAMVCFAGSAVQSEAAIVGEASMPEPASLALLGRRHGV